MAYGAWLWNLYQAFYQIEFKLLKIKLKLSDPKPITIGVPQDSILVLLLFISYIDDLSNILKDFMFIMFADDTTLICRDVVLENLVNRCSAELKTAHEWTIANKLSLNTSKTFYTIFGRKTLPDLLPSLKISNVPIPYCTAGKFLGLTKDNNLIFANHIQYTLL